MDQRISVKITDSSVFNLQVSVKNTEKGLQNSYVLYIIQEIAVAFIDFLCKYADTNHVCKFNGDSLAISPYNFSTDNHRRSTLKF